jgi:uncharacterized protein (DUF305 family)
MTSGTMTMAEGADNSGHDMSNMQTSAPADAAGKAYTDGMARMNKAMAAAMSGDPDRDFVTMMIPHHQGAIDMAKVQLQYGKDPELRTLSEGVVKAQESEIAFMKDWLSKH